MCSLVLARLWLQGRIHATLTHNVMGKECNYCYVHFISSLSRVCSVLEALRHRVSVARGHRALHALALVVARHGLILRVDDSDSVKDHVRHWGLLVAEYHALAEPCK